MSFLEVRDRGLPYGGIPYEELLNKLEETDMNETSEDIQTNYNNYIRSEIVDRTLDKPFLESDKTRRDGSISKSVINLRYNGSRGEYEHPVHPELFYGFMDQDTRGLDNNPRMDQYQEQIATRMPNLEIRMGYNCTDNDYQSPWTNQSLGQCRRDIQTALAYNTKIFTDERDGRALNRNFIVEYDHNKKPLIYRDMIPHSINATNIAGKNNMQYTTSAVPFVSTDASFVPSYNNNIVGFVPEQSCNARNIRKDQQLHEEFVNNTDGNSYALQQESKMKTNNVDQVYEDQLNNQIGRNLQQGTKYIADKTNADISIPDISLIDPHFSKNKAVNTITNPSLFNSDQILYNQTPNNITKHDHLSYSNANKLMHADIHPNDMTKYDTTIRKHDSMKFANTTNYITAEVHPSDLVAYETDIKKIDSMKYSNANNFITSELHPSDILSYETDIQKHISLYGNNNNITLVNSSFYIPEFKFRHTEIAKHGYFPDNQTVISKTKQDAPYGSQDENMIKANKFKFTDDVGTFMKYNSAHVPDTTYETQHRHFGNYQQDNKLKNVNNENIWTNSNENMFGKTQKQGRTGGIEPTDMEIAKSHDMEAGNGGAIIGKKSIRSDNFIQDIDNTFDEADF